MTLQHELTGLEAQDFLLIIHNFIESLVAELADEREVSEETNLYLRVLIPRPKPYLLVEDLLADLEEDAFVRYHYWEDRAMQAITFVNGLVADDSTRCVLCQILKLKGIFVMVAQHNPTIEDNKNVVLFSVDYIAGLLDHHSEVWEKFLELFRRVALLPESLEEGLVR